MRTLAQMIEDAQAGAAERTKAQAKRVAEQLSNPLPVMTTPGSTGSPAPDKPVVIGIRRATVEGKLEGITYVPADKIAAVHLQENSTDAGRRWGILYAVGDFADPIPLDWESRLAVEAWLEDCSVYSCNARSGLDPEDGRGDD